jgi:act minimal PKS acyl carrier protein
MEKVSLDDIKQIMRECAGEDEGVDLDGDIADRGFDELGYDSLAVLETASRIQRRFAITVPDDDIALFTTPAKLVDYVNDRITAAV